MLNNDEKIKANLLRYKKNNSTDLHNLWVLCLWSRSQYLAGKKNRINSFHFEKYKVTGKIDRHTKFVPNRSRN